MNPAEVVVAGVIGLAFLAAGAVALRRALASGSPSGEARTERPGARRSDPFSTTFLVFLTVYAAVLVVRQWGHWEWGRISPIIAAGALGMIAEVLSERRTRGWLWGLVAVSAVAFALTTS